MTRSIALLLLASCLISCSKSLVYSPSINLTTKPLKEKEIDVQGGLELLPEARPEALGGSPTTLGLTGQFSYGFTDKFNLSVKAWLDVEEREAFTRLGYSLAAQFIKPMGEGNSLIFLPRIGIALNGSNVNAYGIGASAVYQAELNENLSWYGGLGWLWGFRKLEQMTNDNNEEKLPMGIGLMGNLGLSWQLFDAFRLNCELNPIYQVNAFDENTQFLVAPSIGVGYTLNR